MMFTLMLILFTTRLIKKSLEKYIQSPQIIFIFNIKKNCLLGKKFLHADETSLIVQTKVNMGLLLVLRIKIQLHCDLPLPLP